MECNYSTVFMLFEISSFFFPPRTLRQKRPLPPTARRRPSIHPGRGRWDRTGPGCRPVRVGWDVPRRATSATALPSPPMTECSSAVTIAPVSPAAWSSRSRSSGLRVWISKRRASMPDLRQLFGSPGAASDHRAGGDQRQVLPISQGQPLADLQFRACLVYRQRPRPADPQVDRAVELGH